MFTYITTVVIGSIIFCVIEILALTFILMYEKYLVKKVEKQCKHICLFCKYKDRCDWYNR